MAGGRVVSCLLVLAFLAIAPAGATHAQENPPLSPEDQAAEQLEGQVLSHLKHGRLALARPAYEQLQAQYGSSVYAASARVLYADIDLEQGRVQQAIDSYTAALPLIINSDDKAALCGKIGMALVRAGDLEGAVQNLRECLKRTTRWDDKTAAQTWLLEVSMLEAEALSSGRFSECGRDSLSLALAAMGRKEDAEAIREVKVKSFTGLSAAEVVDLAKGRGIDCWAIRVGQTEFPGIACPFVAHYGERHFVMVRSVGDDKVTVVDPLMGEAVVSKEEFSRKFTGEAIVFAQTDVEKGRELTLAEAKSVRGGCGVSMPPYPQPNCNPQGNNSEASPPTCDCPPCGEDPGGCVDANNSTMGVNYGIIPDIPVSTHLAISA